jgi:ribosomal protein S18 acetylase RimI-like enzyme
LNLTFRAEGRHARLFIRSATRLGHRDKVGPWLLAQCQDVDVHGLSVWQGSLNPQTAGTMRIAQLNFSDAPCYRDLMLEAYEQAADAFTSTTEERAREPLTWWEKRIASADGLSESFGAFAAGSLVGTVALEYSAKPKTRHSALIIGMYVRPAHRRSGAARALMHAAIQAATTRPEVQSLRLTVTEGNEPAIRLYESVGFVAWGTEPFAIRTPQALKGKVHMSMWLPRAVPTNDVPARLANSLPVSNP